MINEKYFNFYDLLLKGKNYMLSHYKLMKMATYGSSLKLYPQIHTSVSISGSQHAGRSTVELLSWFGWWCLLTVTRRGSLAKLSPASMQSFLNGTPGEGEGGGAVSGGSELSWHWASRACWVPCCLSGSLHILTAFLWVCVRAPACMQVSV